MKRYLLPVLSVIIVLNSCSGTRQMGTVNDDVYLDPKRDKDIFYPKPTEQAVASAPETATKTNNTVTDNNNPYYKDKDFSYDDYYDNEYAARLKRFRNPLNGVSYYDSYYTNSYFYNNNPYQYGVSIYNGYNWWGPSYYNYSYVPSYNWGGYYGYGTCYGYNPYYNYSPWNSSYYNSYNNWYGWNNPYGFNNGLYNPYSPYSPYNTYGYNPYYPNYQNSYDYTSSTYYGPRTSHGGSNSSHVINPKDSRIAMPHKTEVEEQNTSAPTNVERFNQVVVPKSPKHQLTENQTVHGGSGTIVNNAVSNTDTPHTFPAHNQQNPHVIHTESSQPVKSTTSPEQAPASVGTSEAPKKNHNWIRNALNGSGNTSSSNTEGQTTTTEQPSRNWHLGGSKNDANNNNTPAPSRTTTRPSSGNESGKGSYRPR